MALREDYSPSDSTELWTHFNDTNRGVNRIGQTWRGMFGGGIGAGAVDVAAQFNAGQNVAPDLNRVGSPYGATITMDTPPVRASNGRRFAIDPGPYRLHCRFNWETKDVDGLVWAGILINPTDSGQNYIGALSGILMDENTANVRRNGKPAWAGVSVESSTEVDLVPGDTFMFVTRYEGPGTCGLRFNEKWTKVEVTRIGH